MSTALTGYDWEHVFVYAENPNAALGEQLDTSKFTLDDVDEVIGIAEGENDGPGWIAVGRLRDGRWFRVSAWCDYTGWGCQEGGDSVVSATREGIIQFGMTEEERARCRLEREP